jgi:hypothetical protein
MERVHYLRIGNYTTQPVRVSICRRVTTDTILVAAIGPARNNNITCFAWHAPYGAELVFSSREDLCWTVQNEEGTWHSEGSPFPPGVVLDIAWIGDREIEVRGQPLPIYDYPPYVGRITSLPEADVEDDGSWEEEYDDEEHLG